MRAFVVFAFAAACGKPVVAPAPVGPAPTPDPKPAPVTKPKDEIDSGIFISRMGDAVGRREAFSIRRLASGNLVIAAVIETDGEKTGGEVEVDAQFRPVRGSYRTVSAADGKTYKIGGDPLTLEVTRDDGNDPQKFVAKKPVEVYIDGPGAVAMTALCRVNGETVLTAFGDEDVANEYLEAYVGAPVGEMKRVILNLGDYDFELACSGDKLIAGGLAQFNIWFVREGREADLESLQKAPRPGTHAWKSPQDETERWHSYHAWLVDKKLVVTRDARRRMQRLTTFDAATGRELAHRDFKTKSGTHLECMPQPQARLFCVSGPNNLMRLLDARTLADVDDYVPIVTGAIPNAASDRWTIDRTDGNVVDVILDDERVARIDTKKKTAVSAPMPKERNLLRAADPARYEAVRSEGFNVGKEKWTPEVAPNGTKVKRTVGTKELAPIEIPLKYATLLSCAPKGFAAYAVTYSEAKSVLALVGTDGALKWQVALEAHPDEIRVNGGDLLVTSHDQHQRVHAIDPKKGAIKWTAAGPLAAK